MNVHRHAVLQVPFCRPRHVCFFIMYAGGWAPIAITRYWSSLGGGLYFSVCVPWGFHFPTWNWPDADDALVTRPAWVPWLVVLAAGIGWMF